MDQEPIGEQDVSISISTLLVDVELCVGNIWELSDICLQSLGSAESTVVPLHCRGCCSRERCFQLGRVSVGSDSVAHGSGKDYYRQGSSLFLIWSTKSSVAVLLDERWGRVHAVLWTAMTWLNREDTAQAKCVERSL